jgi:endonuclease YncB( thermonuclease family)/Tfp pilus assembly protein PilF
VKFRLQMLFVVTFISLFACRQVLAATLHGLVVEVLDGENISVRVEKRLIKVRLCALSAPKLSQPLADVAREHLSQLLNGKQVAVEYLGLDRGGPLVAVVTLNDSDIGMQMIRDGAAFYNKSESSELPAQLRGFYEESERLARGEVRGIWQNVLHSANEGSSRSGVEASGEDSKGLASAAEAKRINDDAYVLIQQLNYKSALSRVREALRMDPKLAEAHKNLALIFCDTGKPEEGIAAGLEAIRLKPDSDKAHNVMGKIRFSIGDYPGAVREYGEAIRLNPGDARAHFDLGVTFMRMKQFDRALQAYEEAGRLDRQWAEVELNSGWVLYEMGRRAEARERWQKVLTMNDPVAALKAEANIKEIL